MEKVDKENQEIANFNSIREALLLANPDTQAMFTHFFNEGVKTGLQHTNSSESTKKTFITMENNMTKIEIEMQKLKGNQELHGEILKRIETKIDKQDDHFGKHMEDHEKLEDKFAAKQTEEDLKLLMNSLRQQQFEWLKYVVAVLVSVLVTVVVYNKFRL